MLCICGILGKGTLRTYPFSWVPTLILSPFVSIFAKGQGLSQQRHGSEGGEKEVEEEVSLFGIVCTKKYEETESCGSAADFLSGVAINASVGVSGDDLAGVRCGLAVAVPFLLEVGEEYHRSL